MVRLIYRGSDMLSGIAPLAPLFFSDDLKSMWCGSSLSSAAGSSSVDFLDTFLRFALKSIRGSASSFVVRCNDDDGDSEDLAFSDSNSSETSCAAGPAADAEADASPSGFNGSAESNGKRHETAEHR